MGQARTLLSLKDKKQLVTLAQRVIKEQLTVRQLEDLVQQLNEKSQAKQIKRQRKQTKAIIYLSLRAKTARTFWHHGLDSTAG